MNNVHNDDLAYIEEELKRFKALQNADDHEAMKRRKDLLSQARQERINAYGDKSDDDDDTVVSQSMDFFNENSNNDDDFDQYSMPKTQNRTQASAKTTRGSTRGRGRGRAKTTPTTTRGKRKPF